MRGVRSAVVVLVSAAAVFPATGQNPDRRADELAKTAVVAYLKGFQAEDVDAVMRAVAVPFVMNDRGKVETGAALRAEFTRIFDRSDLSTLKYEVKAVGTLEAVRGRLAEKRHEAKLKAVLEKDGRVVLVDAELRKGRAESMSFAVRVRDGTAVVTAMFD
jgi:hypothetical protein